MPVGLEGYCQRILEDIEITSLSIRRSALACANRQNFEVSERLRHELETIRISSDAILTAITKASVMDYTLDDGLMDWIFSGGLHSCLGKLKEMETMLKPVDPVRPAPGHARPSRPGEDKISAVMAFFDRHKGLFHFLITSDIWSHARHLYQPSELDAQALGADHLSVPEGTVYHQSSNIVTTGCDVQSDMNHTSKTRYQKESQRRQLEEILRWLAALDCTGKHNYIRQLRQEGTCRWFPDTNLYEKWRSRGAQFLWLHGKAGCGKSVLAASAIEHLKTTLQYEEVIAFFYFDFQNERSRSPAEMMRSVLSQLCRHLLDLGVDPGSFPSTMLEEKGKGSLSLNNLDKLCGLVSCAADRFVREPIVVIDALDECADIESLLRALVALRDDDKVRLLVTSRPHHDMMRHLAQSPSLSFEDMALELARDIELHVRREINYNQLKFTGLGMQKEIHAKLNEKAEGRFRWVQCQIDILKRCTTTQELENALDNLPTELEATYERILDAIDERRLEGKLARRVLAWLMVALEPLRLAQICDTLSVDFPSQRGVICDGIELIEMLSSLVAHYKETDVVSLSHFSVKEYLTGRTRLPMYQVILNDAHVEAVQSCMRYVSAFVKQAPRKITSGSWPMLSYIFSSGFSHLALIDPESISVLDALRFLGSDVRHHPSHWDRLCQLREEDLRLLYPPWPSARHDFVLYILVAYASTGLFRTFLSDHRPIKARTGTNPLVYAADLRKTNHAIALLECGIDPNARSLAIDDSYHVSPLEVSIDRDEEVLVGELLQRGCPVTSQLLATAICMPWCSARVLVKLTQTDEFMEWAHMIGDEKLYRSIFSSARPNAGDIGKADENHVALARRLRQIGQDLSTESPFGAELINRALHAAHISMLEYLLPVDQPPPAQFLLAASTGSTSETVSIVRFLLGRGADINVVSRQGDTLIHFAAMCPWEPRSLELIKLLIDAGCNPHVSNSRGETLLTIAVNREHVSVVEYLLTSNIFPPSSALLEALQQRLTPKIVVSMIRGGADVNSMLNGESVLHLAITKYEEPWCLELVKSFIEAGCNTTVCNSMGETALHTAIKRKYASVVGLLSHNDPLPSSILQFALQQRSPVQLVQVLIRNGLLSHNLPLPPNTLPFVLHQRSPLRLVQLLVHNGANVHSTTPKGKTMFHLAIAKYDESTCLELVKSFVEAGGNATIRDFKQETALHLAIRRGYTSVANLLLPHNDPLPHDILPSALRERSPPHLVRLLICNGADVYSASSEGETIFHLAVTNYDEPTCLELVKSFTKAGGNATTCDSKGETALYRAIRYGRISAVKFLLSYNVPLPNDILPYALQQCSPLRPWLVRLLIHNGADMHSTSSEGETLFHLAIANHREPICLELVKSFIEAGSSIALRNSKGETALYPAIRRGYTSVVKLLLSHNVPLPPNSLLLALQQRSPPQLVQLLIRNEADVRSTTTEGETILHLAIANYSEPVCLEFVAEFIETDAGNPTVCNSDGRSALDSAIECGYDIVFDFLLESAEVRSTISDREFVLLRCITRCCEPLCLISVKNYMKAGYNTNIRSSIAKTALRAAIKRGYISVVELLLSHNVPLPRHILLFALRQRSPPQLVRLLTRNGASVHSTTPEGETIVHLAIANYNELAYLVLVKSFVEAGGDIAVCNSKGETVLHTAIKHKYISLVELLLSRNVPLPPDILPFALQHRSPPCLVQLLIRQGADIHSATPKGESIFHLVIANYSIFTRLELLKSFLEAGGNPTARNSEGETILHTAIKRGYTSLVKLLLSHNVSLPPIILPFALQQCSPVRLVRLLIRSGAALHSTTPEGETIFHLAIANYNESLHLGLVKSFIEAGGNPATCNHQGEAALHIAIKRGYTSLVELLLSRNVPLPSSLLAFTLQQCSPPRLVQLLLCNGADVHSTSSEGETISYLAVANYNESVCLELVKSFIEAGSNLAVCSSKGRFSALHIAIERRYISVIELLLLHNAPLPLSVLPFALQQHSPPSLVQLLIRNGADVHSTSSEGETVFHLAIANYDEPVSLELVKSFVEAGGDIKSRNSMGETVLPATVKRGYTTLAEALISSYDLPLDAPLHAPLSLPHHEPLAGVSLTTGTDIYVISPHYRFPAPNESHRTVVLIGSGCPYFPRLDPFPGGVQHYRPGSCPRQAKQSQPSRRLPVDYPPTRYPDRRFGHQTGRGR